MTDAASSISVTGTKVPIQGPECISNKWQFECGHLRYEKQHNCKHLSDRPPAFESSPIHRTKCDDSTIFLGDGSLASAPTPKLSQKGIRSVIKVVDDKCL
jgi:hypothetical protein